MSICQMTWVLLSMLSSMWLNACSSLLIQAFSIWAYATMPVVAKILSLAILLLVGSHPTQLIFHAAQQRMTAQYPPTIHYKQCFNHTVVIYEILIWGDQTITLGIVQVLSQDSLPNPLILQPGGSRLRLQWKALISALQVQYPSISTLQAIMCKSSCPLFSGHLG